MDFLKKKPEIKKRTKNYNFNESKLDEYTDIQIEAFVKEYYKGAKRVDQSTAYHLPSTMEYKKTLKDYNVSIQRDRPDYGGFNIAIGGIGIYNGGAKRTLAKIIE